MSLLPAQTQRPSQPQQVTGIDWSNPITRGLVMASTPTFPGNMVTGTLFPSIRPGVTADQAGITTGAAAYFEEVAPVNSSDKYAVMYDLNVLTVAVYARQSTAQNSDYCFVRGNGSSAPHWGIGLHGGSFNGVYAQMGSANIGPSAPGVSTLTPRLVAMTADGTTMRAYNNGIEQANATYTPATYAYDTVNHRRVIVGRGGTLAATSCRASLFLFWNRALTPSEIKSLSANPWQVFAPVRRQLWASVSGGAANTLTPGTGHETFTGYAPAFANTVNLTPGTGHEVFTGHQPTLGGSLSLQPNTGHFNLTGYPGTLTLTTLYTPGTGHEAFTGHQPTFANTALLTPGTGHETYTGHAPGIARGYLGAVGHLLFTGHQPTISQSANLTLTPLTGHLNLTGYQPSIPGIANISQTFKPAFRPRRR